MARSSFACEGVEAVGASRRCRPDGSLVVYWNVPGHQIPYAVMTTVADSGRSARLPNRNTVGASVAFWAVGSGGRTVRCRGHGTY